MFSFISVKIPQPGLLAPPLSGGHSPGTHFTLSRTEGNVKQLFGGKCCKCSLAPSSSPAEVPPPPTPAPEWPVLTPGSGKQGSNSRTGESKIGNITKLTSLDKSYPKQGHRKTQWTGISKSELNERDMQMMKPIRFLEF